MKQFEKVLEEWAIKYKPMQHVPGETSPNKRLFFFDSIVAIPDFMTKMNVTKSPCMGYEFPLSGDIKGGKLLPDYTIYFFVNQKTNKIVGKEQAAEVNQEALTHALKFIAWLKKKQETNRKLANINLENIPYRTYGPFLNGWYGIFIQLRDVDTFSQCVDAQDYVE